MENSDKIKVGIIGATGYAGENGLGPVCQILNIPRSDRLNHLVSISTHQAEITEYARRTFGKGSRRCILLYRDFVIWCCLTKIR